MAHDVCRVWLTLVKDAHIPAPWPFFNFVVCGYGRKLHRCIKKSKYGILVKSTKGPFVWWKSVVDLIRRSVPYREAALKPVNSEQTLAIKFQSQGHARCHCLMLREWGDRGLPHSVTPWNKFIPHTPTAYLSVNTLNKSRLWDLHCRGHNHWLWTLYIGKVEGAQLSYEYTVQGCKVDDLCLHKYTLCLMSIDERFPCLLTGAVKVKRKSSIDICLWKSNVQLFDLHRPCGYLLPRSYKNDGPRPNHKGCGRSLWAWISGDSAEGGN